MQDLISKRLAGTKVILVLFLISIALYIGSFIVLLYLPSIVSTPVIIALTYAVLALGLIYFIAWLPFANSIKRLQQMGLENIADDIDPKTPTLPRSKLFCGQRAFFCKKPYVIIPYAQVAWVYLYERKAYGVITVEKAVILFTKDGHKYTLRADTNEFKWLLENYIILHAPQIVLGYGARQKKLYKQRNPEAVQASNRKKVAWGLALMAFGAFLLVIGLINNTLMNPQLIIIGISLISGCILLILGKKK